MSFQVSIKETGDAEKAGTAQEQFSHPLMHDKTTDEAIVTFDGDQDPYHPLNWPLRKKVITTICYGLLSSCTTYATST